MSSVLPKLVRQHLGVNNCGKEKDASNTIVEISVVMFVEISYQGESDAKGYTPPKLNIVVLSRTDSMESCVISSNVDLHDSQCKVSCQNAPDTVEERKTDDVRHHWAIITPIAFDITILAGYDQENYQSQSNGHRSHNSQSLK